MLDDDDTLATEEPQDGAQLAAVTETPAPAEGATAAPEGQDAGGEAKPDATPKPRQADRRFAHLQARTSEAMRRAEEAERRAEAAEAMLRQAQNGGTQQQPAAPTDRAEIVAEAQRLVAEERVRERRQAVIDGGVKDLGAEVWNEKTAMLHSMGALARPEFMEALVDIPDAHRLVAALADDPDQLKALLDKRPAAMAASMGRMAAELNVADAPKPKEISRVAPPVRPVGAGRPTPAPDPAKMTTQEYIAFRNRTAPKKLGGQGQAA
jgi:hypothetical protein